MSDTIREYNLGYDKVEVTLLSQISENELHRPVLRLAKMHEAGRVGEDLTNKLIYTRETTLININSHESLDVLERAIKEARKVLNRNNFR